MDKRFKVTDDQRTDIIAAALAGEKQVSIAKRLGLSEMTISRLVREVTGVNKSRNIDETKRQAIIDAFTQGMTLLAVAEKYGTTPASVRNVLAAAGIDSGANKPRVVTKEQRKEIVERFRQGGVTRKELAQEYGIEYETLGAILRRAK